MEEAMIRQMLELIDAPAFAVLDGTVTHVNPPAEALMIAVGSPLEPMLGEGSKEYSQVQASVLSVSLILGDTRRSALVRSYPPYHIFRMEGNEHPELNALALAAQQLCTPLTDLGAGMELLMPRITLENDERLEAYISRMNRSYFRMLRLLDNMGDAARYATNQPNPESTNLTALVAEIAEKTHTLCQSTGKELIWHLPEQPLFTAVDRIQLEKVLYNLLANALKFTEPGGCVSLSLTEAGKLIHISLEDTGGGIEEGLMVNLFTRYARTPMPEDIRHGIGLGLSMARSFAHSHDGSILLRNTEKGLKLTLTLPKRNAPTKLRTPPLPNPHTELDRARIALSESLPASEYFKK